MDKNDPYVYVPEQFLNESEISKNYFNWLYQKMLVANNGGHSYELLCKVLFETPFIYTDARDIARANDGRYLYSDFLSENNEYDPTKFFTVEATVLEVLIALADRIERHFMRNPDYGDRTALWFYEMLSNLGLLQYDDEHFDQNSLYEISVVLNHWMDRQIDSNGVGGLFPLKNAWRDQRTIEIWSQLNDYMNERLDIL